ncbi:MAG: hypothetical protein ABUL63_03355 [Acidobacteriota bacterium]
MSSRGFLILRRRGVLWGIDNAEVAGLARNAGSDLTRTRGFRVELGGRALAADDVLGVVDSLLIRPLSPVLRRFWPAVSSGLSGMAVHAAQPLLVVDPRQPPHLLWLDEGDAIEGSG